MNATPKVKVGAISVAAPEGASEALAQELAAKVESRLKEIEGESGRIDTLGFALQVALEYAYKVQLLARDRQRETAELVKVLAELNAAIEETLPPATS
jgi:cell division protein ZapA (FtsZ GTPase activity inhibitor)